MDFSPDIISLVTGNMIESLSDYSTDQRGDIGSWIRITALSALGQIMSLSSLYEILPEPVIEQAISGIIKQSVEKLEPCRNQAYKTMVQLRQAGIAWDRSEAMSFEVASRYVT